MNHLPRNEQRTIAFNDMSLFTMDNSIVVE